MNLPHVIHVLSFMHYLSINFYLPRGQRGNGGRYPIPGNVQGQAVLGSEQPYLVEDVPAHCRRIVLNELFKKSLPIQMIL